MFHPIGPQPPSVYWRRRLILLAALAALIVLIALTARTLATGDSEAAQASGSTTPAVTTPVASTTHPHRSQTAKTSASPQQPASTRTSRSSSAAPLPCAATDLAITAVVAQPTYHVGEQPVLELQVTNTGARACIQDLADKEVELKVYNGESRVWGSHDCQVEPGTNLRTLAMNTPVRVAITWSGLSSQPGCTGTRQRVGAGTYTLYAELSGHTGKATQFTIS